MYSFNPSTEGDVDANHSVLCLVIDRSESMEMMEDQVVTGINSYLEEQRRTNATDNLRTTLVFVRFNHMPELVWSGVDLRYLHPVVYSDVLPRGSTALHDGIAEGMKHTCELLQRLPSLPSKVIMFILTDGEENSSRSWNADQIACEIQHLKGWPYNWEFYFAAANQDAVLKGLSLSMSADQCITFEGKVGLKNALEATGKAHTRMRRGQPKAYTAEDKYSAINSNEF